MLDKSEVLTLRPHFLIEIVNPMALPRRIRHRARSIRISICEAFYIFRHFDFCDFSLPLLARFACALRSLFDSSHPVPLFSMRSVRRLSSVCDPFYLVPSFRARVVHAFVFLVGTEAVSRDGLERDLGESKMGSTSGLRASGINASM